MTSNNNEIKILGKYRLDEVCVDFTEDGKLEGFFLKETNEQVFPTLWDEAYDFGSDGYAAVKKGERWGFTNAMGELIVLIDGRMWDNLNSVFQKVYALFRTIRIFGDSSMWKVR